MFLLLTAKCTLTLTILQKPSNLDTATRLCISGSAAHQYDESSDAVCQPTSSQLHN